MSEGVNYITDKALRRIERNLRIMGWIANGCIVFGCCALGLLAAGLLWAWLS